MFRLITIEREYGCGGGAIAADLARRLGWKLWDRHLTEEIARLANVELSAVSRCEERMDSSFYRLAKTFWRGSYERSSHLGDQAFDADRMVSLMEQIAPKIAKEGNAVVVGRGAPYFLREHPDAFHVFLYAPRAEKASPPAPGRMHKIPSRRSGRHRGPRAHRLRQTLLRRRLAHPLPLPRNDQHGRRERSGNPDNSKHHALSRRRSESNRLRTPQSLQFRLGISSSAGVPPAGACPERSRRDGRPRPPLRRLIASLPLRKP